MPEAILPVRCVLGSRQVRFMVKREQPASDPARKVRFGIKKVLSCEQEEATMPAGAFYGQEATMPAGAFYGQEAPRAPLEQRCARRTLPKCFYRVTIH
jgi:hypothetical protein